MALLLGWQHTATSSGPKVQRSWTSKSPSMLQGQQSKNLLTLGILRVVYNALDFDPQPYLSPVHRSSKCRARDVREAYHSRGSDPWICFRCLQKEKKSSTKTPETVVLIVCCATKQNEQISPRINGCEDRNTTRLPQHHVAEAWDAPEAKGEDGTWSQVQLVDHSLVLTWSDAKIKARNQRSKSSRNTIHIGFWSPGDKATRPRPKLAYKYT